MRLLQGWAMVDKHAARLENDVELSPFSGTGAPHSLFNIQRLSEPTMGPSPSSRTACSKRAAVAAAAASPLSGRKWIVEAKRERCSGAGPVANASVVVKIRTEQSSRDDTDSDGSTN